MCFNGIFLKQIEKTTKENSRESLGELKTALGPLVIPCFLSDYLICTRVSIIRGTPFSTNINDMTQFTRIKH